MKRNISFLILAFALFISGCSADEAMGPSGGGIIDPPPNPDPKPVLKKEYLVAQNGSKLVEVDLSRPGTYSQIAGFTSRIQEFSLFSDGERYLVDTLTELCTLNIDGTNKSCIPFIGVGVRFIDDDNVVFARAVDGWIMQIFHRRLSDGVEKQITFNECEAIDYSGPCWISADTPIMFDGKILALFGHYKMYQSDTEKIPSGFINFVTGERTVLFTRPRYNPCWSQSVNKGEKQISFGCIGDSNYAGIFDMNTGVFERLPNGTQDPSFIDINGDPRWIVMEDGDDAVFLDKNKKELQRISIPGIRLREPKLVIH